MMKKYFKGFTIIELIMVIVLLGILAVVAVPKFMNLAGYASGVSSDADVQIAKKQLATGVAGAAFESGTTTTGAMTTTTTPAPTTTTTAAPTTTTTVTTTTTTTVICQCKQNGNSGTFVLNGTQPSVCTDACCQSVTPKCTGNNCLFTYSSAACR